MEVRRVIGGHSWFEEEGFETLYFDKATGVAVLVDNVGFSGNKFVVFKLENLAPVYYHIPNGIAVEYNKVIDLPTYAIVGCGNNIFLTDRFVVLTGQQRMVRIGAPTSYHYVVVARILSFKFSNIFKKLRNYLFLLNRHSEIILNPDILVLKKTIKDSKGRNVNIVTPKTLKLNKNSFVIVKNDRIGVALPMKT